VGSSSWLTDEHRLSRTAPLLSALLNWPAPLRLGAQELQLLSVVTQSLVKSTGQHARKSLPPGCHSLHGQETGANQRSPYTRASPVIGRGREEKLRGKFHAYNFFFFFYHGVRFFSREGQSGKSKLLLGQMMQRGLRFNSP